MPESRIHQPIFVIGVPRSGTTLVFDVLASHAELAWFSQYSARFPSIPIVAALSRFADLSPIFRKAVTRSSQRRPWIEKFRIGPVEAYELFEKCCGKKFRYEFLLGVEPSERERRALRRAVALCLRYQGKSRFATKITGPGRIGYLTGIFPDANFIHVVRDGRAVVRSLLRAPFWRESSRMQAPAWQNGLQPSDLSDWKAWEHSPAALAAVQWRAIITRVREEAQALPSGHYAEVRYEDFIRAPHETTEAILEHCRLERNPAVHNFLSRRFELQDMNLQWPKYFSGAELHMLWQLLGCTLVQLGYDKNGYVDLRG